MKIGNPFQTKQGESTILSRSGGVKGLSWSRAGNLGVPLEWTRCVGKHLGSLQGWHVPFCTSIRTWAYMTTGKTIPWTSWNFVGKVMSLLSNMLSRFVTAFLPRSKRLLISWLQLISLAAVILEPKKVKSITVCIVSKSVIYLPWSDGTRCHDLRFLNVEF